MKPLYLSMTAFGPYAGEQELDFGELKNRSFFLIHGPTGAGKTTILDAMCFALYGDTSGARDGKAMRSDYADPAVLTEVVFDFSIGADRYRIKRVPEQERPKKRGDGTTVKHAEAELYRLVELESALLETGWSKVTEKIENLLGFKSAQFRQVVLLPQGDFRKLLTANSTERQEIMQMLFKTEQYRFIEERLKTKAQELKKAFDELGKEQTWVLQEAAVTAREELAARQQAVIQATECLKQELQKAVQDLEQAQQTMAAAKVLEAKFLEQAGAEQVLVGLKAKVPTVEVYRLDLGLAVKAARLIDVEKALLILRGDRLQLEKELHSSQTAVQVAIQAQAAAEEQLAKELARDAEREQADREVMRLNELSSKANDLVAALQSVEVCRKQAAEAERAKDSAVKKLNSAKKHIEEYNKHYKQQMDIAARLGRYQAQLAELQRVIAARKSLEKVNIACSTAAKQVTEQEKVLNSLEAACRQVKDRLQELQEQWAKGQAGFMAASLEVGKPCPVCGSAHHPRPAEASGQMTDEQQLKAQQQRVQKAEQEREVQFQKLGHLKTEYNTLVNRQQDLERELGLAAAAQLSDLLADEKSSQTSYEAALAAEQQVKKIDRLLSDLEDQRKECEEQVEQAEKSWRLAEAAYQKAEAVANERQLAVPAEYRDPAQLGKAQQQAVKQQTFLRAALETAQTTVQATGQQKIKCQTVLDGVQTHFAATVKRLEADEADFAARLQQAGFADEAEYQQAKKPADYREKLEERIGLFDRELATAKDRATRAQQEVAGLEQPDMAIVQSRLAACQAAHSELLAGYTASMAQVERQAKWLDKLTSINTAISKIEADYGLVGRLAEVVNGTNPYRLTFQRFVLGALLDDVATAANERLKTMSRGRYLLQRTMDRARKNAAGGLELEVFDNYTGVARGVTTLSGGETFLASLSLALGLADVVQSYAGGMHLDTILVDEGFGTLDPECLDFAIKALLDLQRGGRLVGIISHVPELKERIDARLEVVPTERGSRASFKVG
ncbi:Nuclease SbcCD subunit C [bioreactor metagenome]|uniref:Nuclease SbcCD subunit C n=1 Tax=bioreactor metagenome TaxID=1076179 RepID=A0A644SXU2_9ZZZZ